MRYPHDLFGSTAEPATPGSATADRMTNGDVIRVHREDARVAEFIVDDVESFAKETFPTEQVYGDIDHAGLRLITCGGDYDRGAGGYLANTVVFATLAPS